MSGRDTMLTGFSYGQFVIIIPTVLDLMGTFTQQQASLPLAHWQNFGSGSALRWITVFVLAILLGTVASLIKYSRFAVLSQPQGITTSRGLVNTRRNAHRSENVQGFVISQNLAMQVFRRHRLDVLSKAHDRRNMTNTILPCAPWPQVVELMALLEPTTPVPPTPQLTERSPSPWRFSIPPPMLLVGLPLTTSQPPIGAAFVVAGVVGAFHLNRWHGTFTVSEPACAPTLTVRHGLIAPRMLVAPVHSLWGVETVTAPASRALAQCRVTFHCYSGRHMAFRALVPTHRASTAKDMFRGPQNPLKTKENA